MKNFFKKEAAPGPEILAADDIMRRVEAGDTAGLRRYYDQSLKGQAVTRPEWPHLQKALARNDMPMMRFLVTWGARPDTAALATLTADDVIRLRVAGIDPRELPDPATIIAPKPAAQPEDKIPATWKKILQALHQNGAIEAVIAGGALRDLYHDRPVKDIDIFLAAPRFKNPKKLLQKAFNDASIPLESRIFLHKDGYGRIIGQSVREALRPTSRYAQKTTFGLTQAWVAHSKNEEFNIVFIKGSLADSMRDGAKLGGANAWPPVWNLLDRFDVGLCQIAFNGEKLIINPQYEADSENKTLTLLPQRDTSYDHLKRIVTKYPDFKADSAIREKIASTELLQKIAERRRFVS